MRAASCVLLLLAASGYSSARQSETPKETVARLYRDFAWEIDSVPQRGRPGLIDQPIEVLQRYFTDDLTALILADRACAMRTHEICNLDWSPIWDSQDPAAKDLAIKSGSDSASVDVTFVFPPTQERMHLVYTLTQTPHGWRVRYIVSSRAGSLRATLSQKVPAA